VTSGRFVHLGRAIAGFTQDAALCHDLIYHELVHAVLYGKDVQPGGVRREASAMHEALADYFAAAITGDPAIGEWVYLLFPQGGTRVDMPPIRGTRRTTTGCRSPRLRSGRRGPTA
jgi:hypothetical protein